MPDQLQSIFAEALGIPIDRVDDNLRYDTIKEWDSVAHMVLISAIEEKYDIMLETDDVIDMSTVAIARQIIAKYGVDTLL